MTDHLIEWNELQFRVRGDKLQLLAEQFLRDGKAPIERIHFSFSDGLMVVEGHIRKLLSIPFRAEVSRFEVEGKAVHILLDRIAAFGFPVPSLIRSIAGSQMRSDVVTFDASANRLTIFVDRFLPPFVDVDLREIRAVDGGVMVFLGAGGADLPPAGGFNGRT